MTNSGKNHHHKPTLPGVELRVANIEVWGTPAVQPGDNEFRVVSVTNLPGRLDMEWRQ